MKEKLNFKKLLAAVGILSLMIPSSLTVIACNKNQINSIVSPIALNEAFKNFQFNDDKNVTKFIDSNNLSNITKQIEEHIQKFLAPASLVLENQTSNSIVVRAKSDAKNYYGQVTLTWNLKLFEVWGTEVENASDVNVRKGLKGYLYLDSQTQQIKFFDFAGAKNITNVTIDKETEITHNFYFVNKKNLNKEFLIHGNNLTTDLPKLFNNFNFATELQVTLDAKPDYIRIFNNKNNQWDSHQKKDYLIDSSGNII